MSEPIEVMVSGAGAGSALRLEAVLGRGARGAAVVAHPHPVYGGELSNPVVAAIAQGLERAEIAPLRFNFRGCGESEGVPSADPVQADADLSAAFAALCARHPGPYLAAGYSFGAAAALRAAAREPRLARLILVAPPLAMLDRAALRAYGGPIAVLVGDGDHYAPVPELERALAEAQRATLHLLTGEDHFFSRPGCDRIAELVATL
jgi:uncharacterized protein